MAGDTERVYEIYVRADPERIWQGVTDPELTQQYFFGTRVESDWTQQSAIAYRNATGGIDAEGEILEVAQNQRLTSTFQPAWSPQVAGEPPGTVTWDVEPSGPATLVRLTHSGFDFSGPGADQVHLGWVRVLSGLKTLLETGAPMDPPPTS